MTLKNSKPQSKTEAVTIGLWILGSTSSTCKIAEETTQKTTPKTEAGQRDTLICTSIKIVPFLSKPQGREGDFWNLYFDHVDCLWLLDVLYRMCGDMHSKIPLNVWSITNPINVWRKVKFSNKNNFLSNYAGMTGFQNSCGDTMSFHNVIWTSDVLYY